MAVQRGRPKKQVFQEEEVEDAELQDDQSVEEPIEPIKKSNQSDSNVVGDGTFSDYNPFAESVVERNYATPKVASGVIEDIEEPSFVPPTYEDLISERQETNQENEQPIDNPFDNPNPALNDLDDRDKKIACESLVDTCLDAYEQLHTFAQYVVKVDEEELLQKQSEGKIDLDKVIPVTENGDTMTIGEFIGQFNEQSTSALAYDKEFGYKVKPAMIRVFMKRGWGMTDEQFLLYMFGKDVAVKLGIMYQLKKSISSTLEVFEKAHQRSNSPTEDNSYTQVYERETTSQPIEEVEVEDIQEPIIQDSFTSSMNINMPNNPKDPMAGHPKEVREVLKKTRTRTTK